MFKYLWIVALGIAYLLWTIPSIREIWSELKHHGEFSLDALDESTEAWIFVTIATPLLASFVVFLFSKG